MDQWDEIAVDGKLRREMVRWISPCAVEGLRGVHGMELAKGIAAEIRWLAKREGSDGRGDVESLFYNALFTRKDWLDEVAKSVGLEKFWE